jgi:hypothetical protein
LAPSVASLSSGEVCRFCKKPGHCQKDCRSRIAAKAPCVDQQCKPYCSQGQVQSVQEEDVPQFQPPYTPGKPGQSTLGPPMCII